MLARSGRLISHLLLAVALITAAWTLLLLTYGGFGGRVFGIKVMTHDPLRPLVMTIVAAGSYTALNGSARCFTSSLFAAACWSWRHTVLDCGSDRLPPALSRRG